MNKQNKLQLIPALTEAFPGISFAPGETFAWSSATSQVLFREDMMDQEKGQWALLHEVGHALLGHGSYTRDVELLLMEADAWEKAKYISKDFGVTIPYEHEQECLDSYRDWLHARSTCPSCLLVSLQDINGVYRCINCKHSWSVSKNRFCRLYRKTKRS